MNSNLSDPSVRSLSWDIFKSIEYTNLPENQIFIKKIYIDITNDLIAGTILSKIIFWYLPSNSNNEIITKLRVKRDGYLWLAKNHNDWWDEVRLTHNQVRRGLHILQEQNIIITKVYKFDGVPTVHIRLLPDNLMIEYEIALKKSLSELQTQFDILEDKANNTNEPRYKRKLNCVKTQMDNVESTISSLHREHTENTSDISSKSHSSIKSLRSTIQEKNELVSFVPNNNSETELEKAKKAEARIQQIQKGDPVFDAYIKTCKFLSTEIPDSHSHKKIIRLLKRKYDSKVQNNFKDLVEAEIDPVEYARWYVFKSNKMDTGFNWGFYCCSGLLSEFLRYKDKQAHDLPSEEKTEKELSSDSISERAKKWLES